MPIVIPHFLEMCLRHYRVEHTHVAALTVFSQGGVPACPPLNHIKVYRRAPVSGNAGWLEILCFGVMISAAARFLMSALDQAGGVRKPSLKRGLGHHKDVYFADRRAATMSSIAIRIR